MFGFNAQEGEQESNGLSVLVLLQCKSGTNGRAMNQTKILDQLHAEADFLTRIVGLAQSHRPSSKKELWALLKSYKRPKELHDYLVRGGLRLPQSSLDCVDRSA